MTQDDAMRAAQKPTKVEPGSDLHLTMLGVPMGWNFLTGKDYADMIAFGRAVWQEATRQAVERHSAICDGIASDTETDNGVGYLPDGRYACGLCADAIRDGGKE